MHFPVPDPAIAQSAQARAHLHLAARIALGFVALVWAVFLLDWVFDVDPDPFGVRPREPLGLLGILFAPLFHSNFAHIAANTLPLAVLGTAMLTSIPLRRYVRCRSSISDPASPSGCSAAARSISAQAASSTGW